MIFFNGQKVLTNGDRIGGRNYLLNSIDFSRNWTIFPNSKVLSDSYLNGKIISLANDGDATHGAQSIVPNLADEVSQMTWSCFARADNTGDTLHTELWGIDGKYNQPLTTSWHRYVFTGKINTKQKYIYFWGNPTNKGDIQIALPKLELGPIATDWTPAPEDFLNK